MKWIGTQTIYDNVRFIKDVDITGDLNIAASGNLSFGGVDIIDDSSGTTTLKNIDALDATTIATLETAMESNLDTLNSVTSMTSLATLAALTSFGSAGATTDIAAGDLTMYNAVNDGNPTISLGSSATNRLEIKAEYHSSAQTLDKIIFETYSAGSSTDDGQINFAIDETAICQIKDHGININANKGLTIGGNNILSDSSGTTTLSNIDALDTTTLATIGTGPLPGLILDGDKSVTPGDGAMIHVDTSSITDSSTSGSGTATKYTHVNIESPRLLATNSSVTTTDAATLYIDGAPTAHTNQTITNAYALWVDAGDARFDGDIDLEGDIDVNGTLEADAITLGGTALGTLYSPLAGSSNIVTTGTIGTGVWQGTAIASAYLDADTAHISATKQMTHHVVVDDMGTTKQYIGLTEADAENTNTANKFLPFPAIVAGKLLKVALRSNKNLTGHTLTWRLESIGAANPNSATPDILGTQSGAGCNNTTMTTYDFTSSLDSGANAFDASDLVFLSIQSDTDFGNNVIYYITCLWEWDLS